MIRSAVGIGVMAITVRTAANNTIAVLIALLSLAAIIVLLFGIAQAITKNRKPQVVVADLVAPGGSVLFTEAPALSSLLRQCVKRHVIYQRQQAERVGNEIFSPASLELGLKQEINDVQNAIEDSTTTLAIALRAISPDKADPFTALFAIILPPPRGYLITPMLLHRGDDTQPRVGITIEIMTLDHSPVASTAFWETLTPQASPTVSSGVNERLLLLIEPVARWIAVQLVVASVSLPRNKETSLRKGLPRLLAGGLFYAAMLHLPAHALDFGELAREELEQARQQMPHIPLTVTTLASIYERTAWEHWTAGNLGAACANFREAVNLWQEAERLTQDSSGVASELNQTIIIDRMIKAQLESCDPILQHAALNMVTALSDKPIPETLFSNRIWLYNRGCLYAQAATNTGRNDYKSEALRWLGLAFVRNSRTSIWAYATSVDPELAPIRDLLVPFLAKLRGMLPADPAHMSVSEMEELVSRARQ
jgi:hypothetical protein